MKEVLIAYTSKRGQVFKILNKIENIISKHANVKYLNLETNQSINLEKYDYIIVSSSISYGSYHKNMYKFVNNNAEALNKVENTFISVNLTARNKNKAIPENSGYIKKFLIKSNWTPNNITMFAGLLDYPSYNLIDKYMIKLIMHITGGETDITKTVEYTDWNDVEGFANKIIKTIL